MTELKLDVWDQICIWKFFNILRQRCGCVRYWWKVDERRAPPSSVRQIWPKFPHFDDDDPIVQLIASLPLVGASGDRRLRILARNSGPAYRSSNGGCPRPTPLVPHNQPNTRSIIIFSQHAFFWVLLRCQISSCCRSTVVLYEFVLKYFPRILWTYPFKLHILKKCSRGTKTQNFPGINFLRAKNSGRSVRNCFSRQT